MKKLMLVIVMTIMASTAKAGCGVITFGGRKPFFVKVESISIVQLIGKYIIIRGDFEDSQTIAAPPRKAKEIYKDILKQVIDCSNKEL